jgi:hypothetical protein
MDPEELMKAIEQAAANAANDRDRIDAEHYIAHVVSQVQQSTWAAMHRVAGISSPKNNKLDKWAYENEGRVTLQICEVVRIILRKELLGE